MAIPIYTHKVQAGKVEPVQRMAYTGSPSIVIGSVLIYSSGNVDVGGANPTEIVGTALQAVDTNPGFSAANSPATITGRSQTVSVSRPNDSVIYAANFTNGSSTLVTPAQTDVGAQYGITAYSGLWTVDKNKTAGNARVEVVGFDTSVYGGVVFFKWLSSFLSSN